MKYSIRCNGCGRFIKWSNIEEGKCESTSIPDSDVSYEEDLIHCPTCSERYGAPSTTQQFNILR